MTATTTSTPGSATAETFIERHHFLLRRLHSLSGIVPVGLFVIAHLFTNFQMIWGAGGHGEDAAFQHEVDFIHSIPALLFVEIGLWGGIGFHAVLGLVYTFSGKPNVKQYPHADNWRYSLQRATGFVALAFIFLHIATLRWRWNVLGMWDTPFYHRVAPDGGHGHGADAVPMSLPLTAYALQYHWAVVVFYLVGALSVVYHWANGLWTAAITWGVTISVAAQRRWGYVCAGLGAALTLFTAGAVYGALAYDLRADTTAAQRRVLDGLVPGWDGARGRETNPALVPAHPTVPGHPMGHHADEGVAPAPIDTH